MQGGMAIDYFSSEVTAVVIKSRFCMVTSKN